MTRTKDQAAAVLPTLLKALRLPSINRNWKRLTDTADRCLLYTSDAADE